MRIQSEQMAEQCDSAVAAGVGMPSVVWNDTQSSVELHDSYMWGRWAQSDTGYSGCGVAALKSRCPESMRDPWIDPILLLYRLLLWFLGLEGGWCIQFYQVAIVSQRPTESVAEREQMWIVLLELFLEMLYYWLAKALLEMENMPTAVRARSNCQFAIPASLRIKKVLTIVIQTEVISIDNYCMDWRVTLIRALKMWSASPITHSYSLFSWSVLAETENSCWCCRVGTDHLGIILERFVSELSQCTFWMASVISILFYKSAKGCVKFRTSEPSQC